MGTIANIINLISVYGKENPIISILIILWNILGIIHFMFRRQRTLAKAIVHCVFEGPGMWIYLITIILYASFMDAFVSFIGFVKRI